MEEVKTSQSIHGYTALQGWSVYLRDEPPESGVVADERTDAASAGAGGLGGLRNQRDEGLGLVLTDVLDLLHRRRRVVEGGRGRHSTRITSGNAGHAHVGGNRPRHGET